MEIEKKKAKTLILKFNAGEQCFCCSKIFREKKKLKRNLRQKKSIKNMFQV